MMLLQKKEPVIGKVVLLEVKSIHQNPAQPRKVFSEIQLRVLADSIRQNGLLQPLTVRKDQYDRYELISGERRLRACALIGMRRVPCIITQKNEQESAVLALIENLHREDLNIFEQALALKKLLAEWRLTQEEAASRLGMAQSTLANKLRLLRLGDKEQDLILRHNLTERHARALLHIEDPDRRRDVLQKVIDQNLNVAQTEALLDAQKEEPKKQKHPPIIKDVRLFINTINKAVKIMKLSGIPATAKRREDGEFIEYTVRIPLKPTQPELSR